MAVTEANDTPTTRPVDPETVQEFFDSGGVALRSDAQRGVLRGVKLLGLRSRNGRRYTEAALGQAVGLYEGSKVNVNHPARDALAPRDYRDRLGVVRNTRFVPGEGLFGDLHYNPKHALAEQLAWDAEHAPQNVGLSHNVLARTRREGPESVVEAITRVQSVDLVADPATTAGLFEQSETPAQEAPADLLEANLCLRDELERLREQLARHTRRAQIDELLGRHGLAVKPDEAAVTESFLRQLMAADEDDLSALIEDRARLLHAAEATPPESRERLALAASESQTPADAAGFVEAITRPAA